MHKLNVSVALAVEHVVGILEVMDPFVQLDAERSL